VNWYPHGCPACHGDLHDDVNARGMLICLMCGRSYPAADFAPRLHAVSAAVSPTQDSDDEELAQTA
jgi:uncharacterized protein YbaR (Trm112 family)